MKSMKSMILVILIFKWTSIYSGLSKVINLRYMPIYYKDIDPNMVILNHYIMMKGSEWLSKNYLENSFKTSQRVNLFQGRH